MNPSEYLRAFFQQMSEQVCYSGYTHAISCEEGSLYVLLGIGDIRVKIPLRDLDPDPKQAARSVAARWQELRKEKYIDDYVDVP